ncbi:MAG TPA: DUF3592 domain-containing protein [Thermomicrobiales bacterium]|jgi:hypothetical protein
MNGSALFWRYLRLSVTPLTKYIVIGALAYAALLGYGAWRHWVADYVVRTTGTAVSGQITGQTTLGRRKYQDYLLHVSYRVKDGGMARQAWANVDKSTYERLGRGTSVTLRYLPAEPDRIWIEGDDPGTLWLVLFSLPVLVGPFEVGRVLRLAAHRAQRAKIGATTLGEIVEIVEQPASSQRAAMRDLRYAFTTEDGTRQEGLFIGLPHRIGIFARPGDPISVTYDLHDPADNEPDIFGMDALTPRRYRSKGNAA